MRTWHNTIRLGDYYTYAENEYENILVNINIVVMVAINLQSITSMRNTRCATRSAAKEKYKNDSV